ncbi:MAG: phosphatidylinositol kinase- protein kinase tor1 [Cirrosporium novae-zelandiae]|nr:MAG: phosphatidylinositol kinase- protein kinase tor1 [Cirrosporium novae-zelandiae]
MEPEQGLFEFDEPSELEFAEALQAAQQQAPQLPYVNSPYPSSFILQRPTDAPAIWKDSIMASATQSELQRIFGDLRSRNEEIRLKATYELREHIHLVSKDYTPDKFQDYYNKAVQFISQLIVTSTDPNEKIAGIQALDRLIDFDGVDAAQKTTRFVSYLRHALRFNDNTVIVYAARAIGRLARPGGALVTELVESETQSALEWLQSDRQENRRFAAVLVIRELAKNAPTLLYGHVPSILELIWVAVRDPKVLIRETAAEAVSACFEIILARDTQVRQRWFSRMYDESINGFKTNNIDATHGSLLIIRELLLKGGMFMQEHYHNACEITLRLKEHRDPKIRSQVVAMIPILAAYSPLDFVGNYLHKFMVYLQGLLKKDKERNSAFIAVGKIASAVGSAIAPYLDSILVHIREALSLKVRGRLTDEGPMFECISMLAIAVGQTLTKYMEALMDPMFACGLSESLTQALVDMAHYIPPIKTRIQDKLLDLLSIVLCGTAFKPVGCPNDKVPPLPAYARDYNRATAHHSDAEIALALVTLGSFDFSGHILNEFVRDVAIKYVDNDNPEIRKAAALTSCQIFIRDPIVHQTSYNAVKVVREVIEKLLAQCLADPDPEIRRTVLLSLDPRFDRHLAHPDNIRSLFLAVNDEDFSVREAAISIIGRLTTVNPAYVFPALRKLLINLLTGLKHTNSTRVKEDNAQLLSHFIANGTTLIKAYVDPMLSILLPKAVDSNAGVASTSIKAIGELSEIGGEAMRKYIPQLMPIVIEALVDLSSHTKRLAALRALGQICSSSGYVIEPYLDHPSLLPILLNIIKTEESGPLRQETIKLIGILGALDPYKYQQVIETAPEYGEATAEQNVSDISLITQGLTPSSEEYYPTVVFQTLIQNILKDNSLTQYHSAVIDAIVNIFKTLGLKCVPFLKQVVEGFILVIRNSSPNRLDTYFNQLAILVSIVRVHIRQYLPDILKVVRDYWEVSPQVQSTILSLVESISKALEGEFKRFLLDFVPLMVDVFDKDTTPNRIPSEKILHAFLVFGAGAEQYMHLLIPPTIRLAEKKNVPVSLRKSAIETIAKISKQVNISDHASLLLHPLSRILGGSDRTLRQAALDCICALIFQFGTDFIPYIPMINKVLQKNQIPHQNYQILVTKLQKGDSLPQDLSPQERYTDQPLDIASADVNQIKPPVNQQHLKNAWEVSQKSTAEDWQEWIRRFSVELLKESPSHALRACASLASIYQPLAKDLFNAAFVSCWTELYDQYQDQLVSSLEKALTSPEMPPEILQILLNLAEFMEHDDKALPIDIRVLGAHAAKCHAWAKALHYKELEFEQEQTSLAVEALISINNQLQQTDAAIGILRKAQMYRDVELKETWFEKLQRWEEALAAYQKREADEPDSFEIVKGKMRCLHALGEWDVLSNLAQDKWNQESVENRRLIAPLAAAAAWGLGQWELMDNYLSVMKENTADRSFFGAIVALNRNQFEEASMHIEQARTVLNKELSALLNESYARAYNGVVRTQMLAELEEIITYKQYSSDTEKQEMMRATWAKRLLGCQQNVEVWQRMLKVRSLVVSPLENLDMWIKFANLCRKSNRIGLAEKSLNSLVNLTSNNATDISSRAAPPEVNYAQLKYMWATGYQDEALSYLREFTGQMSDDLAAHNAIVNQAQQNGVNSSNQIHASNGVVDSHIADGAPHQRIINEPEKFKILLAKCYLKQGQWQTFMHQGDMNPVHVREILNSYQKATQHNEKSYKGWHAWALANFEVVSNITSQAEHSTTVASHQIILDHVLPAISGFFKSISLSSSSSLQDTLRLLTLWFAHGGDADVNSIVTEGFSSVSIDTWLEVIPQLIARINQPNARVRSSIHRLLSEVGKAHPQALVYPLTVAMKSNVARRSHSAGQIMDSMRQHSSKLVEQADLVSHELIRVAVLWHELWHEGLEEASRLYFGDHNIEGMFETLAPLHDMITKGPETLREISFTQAFGRDLSEALHFCNLYKQTGETGDLNQAWDLYYTVFRKIARQLPQLMMLDLKFVSPKLKEAKDLDLAVPGTYKSGKPIICIQSFDPIFTVIQSKQRPRKMALMGSDGNSYTYALKGHEDIRQDERVMQLFGLVNTLLTNDSESFKRHLNIQGFPAIPLSQNSGLLGWVPNSDTLHNLIKEYRETRRILLNIEHRIMLQMAPDYDNLTLMQKVEVFTYAMNNTTGKDLYRVLWLKSKSSESWLDRRTNYTRSLAVMSMVGYILGLGDRHPSNLMLDRITGKIIHIDFGDCFEVAMHREKYPERVPFRLTRMLTYAMEVSNIEGSYRITCEAVMRVLRENKESVMAVLEAFIHDPLLNWRLNSRESPARPNFHSERRASIIEDVGELKRAQSPSSLRRRRPSVIDPGTLDPQNGTNSDNREVRNERALQVLARVREKLTGRDFKPNEKLSVSEQVDKLIAQAVSTENLCQHYIGWCSFW